MSQFDLEGFEGFEGVDDFNPDDMVVEEVVDSQLLLRMLEAMKSVVSVLTDNTVELEELSASQKLLAKKLSEEVKSGNLSEEDAGVVASAGVAGNGSESMLRKLLAYQKSKGSLQGVDEDKLISLIMSANKRDTDSTDFINSVIQEYQAKLLAVERENDARRTVLAERFVQGIEGELREVLMEYAKGDTPYNTHSLDMLLKSMYSGTSVDEDGKEIKQEAMVSEEEASDAYAKYILNAKAVKDGTTPTPVQDVEIPQDQFDGFGDSLDDLSEQMGDFVNNLSDFDKKLESLGISKKQTVDREGHEYSKFGFKGISNPSIEQYPLQGANFELGALEQSINNFKELMKELDGSVDTVAVSRTLSALNDLTGSKQLGNIIAGRGTSTTVDNLGNQINKVSSLFVNSEKYGKEESTLPYQALQDVLGSFHRYTNAMKYAKSGDKDHLGKVKAFDMQFDKILKEFANIESGKFNLDSADNHIESLLVQMSDSNVTGLAKKQLDSLMRVMELKQEELRGAETRSAGMTQEEEVKAEAKVTSDRLRVSKEVNVELESLKRKLAELKLAIAHGEQVDPTALQSELASVTGKGYSNRDLQSLTTLITQAMRIKKPEETVPTTKLDTFVEAFGELEANFAGDALLGELRKLNSQFTVLRDIYGEEEFDSSKSSDFETSINKMISATQTKLQKDYAIKSIAPLRQEVDRLKGLKNGTLSDDELGSKLTSLENLDTQFRQLDRNLLLTNADFKHVNKTLSGLIADTSYAHSVRTSPVQEAEVMPHTDLSKLNTLYMKFLTLKNINNRDLDREGALEKHFNLSEISTELDNLDIEVVGSTKAFMDMKSKLSGMYTTLDKFTTPKVEEAVDDVPTDDTVKLQEFINRLKSTQLTGATTVDTLTPIREMLDQLKVDAQTADSQGLFVDIQRDFDNFFSRLSGTIQITNNRLSTATDRQAQAELNSESRAIQHQELRALRERQAQDSRTAQEESIALRERQAQESLALRERQAQDRRTAQEESRAIQERTRQDRRTAQEESLAFRERQAQESRALRERTSRESLASRERQAQARRATQEELLASRERQAQARRATQEELLASRERTRQESLASRERTRRESLAFRERQYQERLARQEELRLERESRRSDDATRGYQSLSNLTGMSRMTSVFNDVVNVSKMFSDVFGNQEIGLTAESQNDLRAFEESAESLGSFDDTFADLNNNVVMPNLQFFAGNDEMPEQTGISRVRSILDELGQNIVNSVQNRLNPDYEQDSAITTSLNALRDELGTDFNNIRTVMRQIGSEISDSTSEFATIVTSDVQDDSQDTVVAILRDLSNYFRTTFSSLRNGAGQVRDDMLGSESPLTRVNSRIDNFIDSTVGRLSGMLPQHAEYFQRAGDVLKNSITRTAMAFGALGFGLIGMGTTLDRALSSVEQFGQQMYGVFQRMYSYVERLGNYTDGLINSNSRIDYVTKNYGDGSISSAKARRLLTSSAIATRRSYEDTANSFARFTQTSSFDKLEGAMTFSDTLSKTMRLEGKNQQEIESTLTQLGQSLASNQMSGEEARAIRENARTYYDSISEFRVSQGKSGELKGATGKNTVTREDMVGGMSLLTDRMDANFKTLPRTFADLKSAFQLGMSNKFMNTGTGMGMMDSIYDTFQYFIDFLDTDEFREIFDIISEVVKSLGKFVVDKFQQYLPLIKMFADNLDTFIKLKVFAMELKALGTIVLVSTAGFMALKLAMLAFNSGVITTLFTALVAFVPVLGTLVTVFTTLGAIVIAFATPILIVVGALAALWGVVKLFKWGKKNLAEDKYSTAYGGYNSNMLEEQGVNSSDATRLEQLYAESNALHELSKMYERDQLGMSVEELEGVDYKALGFDRLWTSDDYGKASRELQLRETEIEELMSKNGIDTQNRFLDDIARNTKNTADELKKTDLTKEIERQTANVKQIQTLATTRSHQIVFNLHQADGENTNVLVSKIESMLKRQRALGPTS